MPLVRSGARKAPIGLVTSRDSKWLRGSTAFALVAVLIAGCGGVADDDDETPLLVIPGDGEGNGPAALEFTDASLGEFSFAFNDCPFINYSIFEVECGTLTVPEDRQLDTSPTIDIAVAILRTWALDPAPDPVVYLNGGPGGVSLATHDYWETEVDDWRDHPILGTRDLILVDQRGTGYSQPSLACEDTVEELLECHDRLVAEGINLSAFSTPENAADFASLRIALGYESWNVFGSSYGTRLASALVRDYPDGVRSVILDGVYPLNSVPSFEQYFDNTLAAFDVLTDLCRSQPGCDRAFGDITDLLASAIDSEDDTQPVVFDLAFDAMYDTSALVDLPLALWLFAEGEFAAALDVLDAEPVGGARAIPATSNQDPEQDSDGKFYSVDCREEHHLTDIDRIDQQWEDLFNQGVAGSLLNAMYWDVAGPVEVCASWNSGAAHPDERKPLVSDVPSLVLAGELDPITPPVWAELAAETLSSSTLVVSPGLSHSSVGQDPCINDIVANFLMNPAASLDTGCVALMPLPTISLPD